MSTTKTFIKDTIDDTLHPVELTHDPYEGSLWRYAGHIGWAPFPLPDFSELVVEVAR